LYLEEMTNLPLATSIRTCSISEIPLTSLWKEHQEDLEDLEIRMEDQTPQEGYLSLILFPFNPQET